MPDPATNRDWADAKSILFVLLGLVAVGFIAVLARDVARARARARSAPADFPGVKPTPWQLFIGFLTDFLDTLGVGSFATTTALYRARNTVDDRLIPGTLNVGHALPTVAQAFIYIEAVKVEMKTLVAMITAAVAGAWLGARIVARWPRNKIRIGMGLALLALGGVITVRQVVNTESGSAVGIDGSRLALGVACNFALGALMTIGIGLYAPCLLLVWLLGMNPTTAFPIMMGSCAFLMPLASWHFIKEGCYSPRAALGLTIGGLPAVLLAAFIVKSLPLYWVKWLVVVVVLYTALSMLRTAFSRRD